MRIEIGPNYTEVSIKRDGVYKSKMVSLSDLLDELSIYRKTNFGLLPRMVRISESSADKILLGIEFEPATRDLKFSGGVVKDCHTPGGIMFVRLRREAGGFLKHEASYIFAIQGKRISFPTDQLYHFPFPNVYEDGKICWGSVSIGDIKKLSAVEGMIASFWNNNFNSDLFSSTRLSSIYDGPAYYKDYFNHIAKNEFSQNWLKPANHTVQKITSKLL